LLDAVIEEVSAHGLGDRSLRQLASAVGTSHRMLIYHFGSKQGLLVEVVCTVEARQRQAFAQLDQVGVAPSAPDEMAAPASGDAAQMQARWWRQLADPAQAPLERLFFELYGQALQGRAGVESFLDGVVDDWLEPATARGQQWGMNEADARDEARLGLAVTRGLLLDLLATGDRAGVDRAMARYLSGRSGVPH
jgi:AcrR family transcriptional regulator